MKSKSKSKRKVKDEDYQPEKETATGPEAAEPPVQTPNPISDPSQMENKPKEE